MFAFENDQLLTQRRDLQAETMASDEECSAIGEYRDDNSYHSLSSYRTGRIATVLFNHLILFEVLSFDDLQGVAAWKLTQVSLFVPEGCHRIEPRCASRRQIPRQH